MCNFDTLSSFLFQPGEKLINWYLIRSIADMIAKIHGWEAGFNKREMICSQSGNTKTKLKDRLPWPFAACPLKQKCGLKVDLEPHVVEPYISEKTKNRLYRDNWKQPLTIISSSCMYPNGWFSCGANRVTVTSASGSYVKSTNKSCLDIVQFH